MDAADTKKPTTVNIRKLAEALRVIVDGSDKTRMTKAAHVLCAGKALVRMQQKVRGWYEPLP